MKDNLRPCLIEQPDGTQAKALFHDWAYEAYVQRRGLPLIGTTGQVCHLWGIVELEDGKVMGVPPEKIQFLDNKFRDYAWPEGGESHDPV